MEKLTEVETEVDRKIYYNIIYFYRGRTGVESVVKNTTKKVGITEVKKIFNRGQQRWIVFGYLCLTKALCARVRAGVPTLDRIRGKKRGLTEVQQG